MRRIISLVALVFLMVIAGCGGEESGPPRKGKGHRGGGAEGGRNGGDEKAETAIAVRIGGVMQEPISSLYSTSATLRADRRATSCLAAARLARRASRCASVAVPSDASRSTIAVSSSPKSPSKSAAIRIRL